MTLGLCTAYQSSVVCWTQAKKIACLSALVAHLKMVEGNHHAIKHLDCEMEKKVECCAKAAGVEAVICCRYACFTPCCQHELNRVHMY